jgi:hypothetical protein
MRKGSDERLLVGEINIKIKEMKDIEKNEEMFV